MSETYVYVITKSFIGGVTVEVHVRKSEQDAEKLVEQLQHFDEYKKVKERMWVCNRFIIQLQKVLVI